MKYCENCGTYKQSWTDRGHSGSNYENKCWTCDKYTLTEKSKEVQRRQNQNLITQTAGISQSLANTVQNNPDVEIKYDATASVRYETNAVIESQTHSLIFRKR